MELIQEAIAKAKGAKPERRVPAATQQPAASPPVRPRAESAPSEPENALHRLRPVQPSARHLERHRIVALGPNSPGNVAFNMLRTNINKIVRSNDLRSVAVTSPNQRCGKTTVAINLALGLARQPNCRVVLVDLDLRKPAIANLLGVSADNDIGHYLNGHATFEDCFVRLGDNLIIGLNTITLANSTEMLHSDRLAQMLNRIRDEFSPQITLFDVPPMLATDDAIAFLPMADSGIIVAAVGQTTTDEIERCASQFGDTAFLGVVLNKSGNISEQYYAEAS